MQDWQTLYWNLAAASNFALPVLDRDATIVGFFCGSGSVGTALLSTRNDTYANLAAVSSQSKPEIIASTSTGVAAADPQLKNIKWAQGSKLYVATSTTMAVIIYFVFGDVS
jgi:hypothetical protein